MMMAPAARCLGFSLRQAGIGWSNLGFWLAPACESRGGGRGRSGSISGLVWPVGQLRE